MEAAMAHVNRRGWTSDALAAGAADAGFPPVTHGLFERGPAELAEYWMDQGNERLESFLQENKSSLRGEDLVVAALMNRLEHTVPYMRSWPQAMALGLHPDNVPTTLQKLQKIPDMICRAADESEGSREWEMRSGAVGSVFAASELYMLTDYSEGYADTRKFVRDRVQNALTLQNRVGPSAETLNAVVGGLGSLVMSAASFVAPVVPSATTLRSAPKPPNPDEMLTQLRKGFSQAGVTAQDIARSPNPALHMLTKLRASANQMSPQNVAEAAANAASSAASTAESSSSSASDSSKVVTYPVDSAPPKNAPTQQQKETPSTKQSDYDPSDLADLQTVDGPSPLAPVQLPSQMSLFGLLSMSGKEAADLVQKSNPDFTVLVTNVNDDSAEPRQEEKLVRLLVNDQDIVVDVLRS
ncbi:Ubiquinone biosynthesis protein COQ9, mitochondrial [Hondaea fermentalgiana]|uniref:Ubiquinone biosynthesis protein n=1 Tax=Hondaea fermentalgiana TaxID=2315210 RepID=A0A2R5GZI8_9STRA|nr:Ubiquinone biosynthesis protein COQ9, mitochondrial [Hondaea fermentalgiana]|eukprot:GBG34183.1 Ubiquinone biosynthesis protein COQ9, mitochondrial [Hondaea fermentalgiana]